MIANVKKPPGALLPRGHAQQPGERGHAGGRLRKAHGQAGASAPDRLFLIIVEPGDDVARDAEAAEKGLDRGPAGLADLKEDELVLVVDDHGAGLPLVALA